MAAFAGLVGLGVGAAVMVITFLLRRPATPFVAFSAIYAAVYNVVNIIVQRPRPMGIAHTTSKSMGFSYPSGHVVGLAWTCLSLSREMLTKPIFATRRPGAR